MTTDIAHMDSNAIAVLGTANEALDRLGRWVTAAHDAHKLVSLLINTAFVPDAYRPKIDPRATPEQKKHAEAVATANATAAVLQGITLGVDPLTAMAQIYIIHGRPGMYAKFMVALVQAHGHEVWTDDLSDTRAKVSGRRRGSEHTETITVTMDMARKAKWTSNAKYQETPQDMLWSRAAARVCDRIASDVIKGIASVEEIQDEIKATAEVGNSTRTVTPRRRTPPPAIDAAVEDPPLDEPAAPDVTVGAAEKTEPASASERSITTAQQRKMHALLREHGKTDRDVALAYITGIIDHDIESTKDLTVLEAGAVIDNLEAMSNAEPPLDEAEPALERLPDGVDGWPVVAQPPASPKLIED